MELAIDFWRRAPSRRKRIISIVAFLVLSVIVTVAGVLTPLSDEEVEVLGEELESTQTTLVSLSRVQQVSFIFGNNLMICVAGFVPVAGLLFEFYVLYSTGVVISAYEAYDEDIQVNPLLLFFSLFIFPFFWLEFLAYSTAMAESVWLIRRILQHKTRREIKNACLLVSACVVMLLAAAIIEVALI